MKRVIVIGSSGQAHVVIDTMEQEGKWQVAGLLDSFRPAGPTPLGYEVLGKIEDLRTLIAIHQIDAVFVGIGDNWTRGRISREIAAAVPGICFASTVHPSAQIARKVQIGSGVVVMAGAVVMPAAEIRTGVLMGTRASLDHDSVMEEFSSLGPGAVTGGNVHIGAYTAVALGAKIVHGVSIGPQAVIGAGSTVLSDFPGNVVVYGTPAKVIRERAAADAYL